MSIPKQPAQPPPPETSVRAEMDVIERCVNALTTVKDDRATLNRVMRYLNLRFPTSVTRNQT